MGAGVWRFASGDVVGPWRLAACLGRGGMGEVWSATDALTGQVRAAIKLVDSGVCPPDLFASEVRALASLHHPAIVRILGADQIPGGAWLAMELLDGETLYDRARAGPLAPSAAADLLFPVADALVACHRAGVFHGDVTPSNVFVHRDGRARLIDFGLSGRAGQGGTPGYSFPGDPVRRDSAALGATLWSAVTGLEPAGQPLPLALPGGGRVDDVIRGLTDPAARPDLAQAGTLLRHFASTHRLGSRPPQTVERHVPSSAPPRSPTPVPDPPPPPTVIGPERLSIPGPAATPDAPPGPRIAPPRADPPRAPRSRGSWIPGLAGVAVALGGLLVLTGGAAAAGWSWYREEHRIEAVGQLAEAWRLVATFKTDPATNRRDDNLPRAADLAQQAAPWLDDDRAAGLGSLVRVWRSGWHFAGAAWDPDRYRADLAAVGAPREGLGRFARGLLQANACRLMPDEADRPAACDDADASLQQAFTDPALADGWLKVEIGWTQAALWNNRAVQDEARDPASAEARRVAVVARCTELLPLVGAAPVNGIELADECVEAAGRVGDWPAFATWTRRLVDGDGATLSQRRAERVLEAVDPSCHGLVVRARGRNTVGQATSEPQRFCRAAGLLALGCRTSIDDWDLYGMSGEHMSQLQALARVAPQGSCPVAVR